MKPDQSPTARALLLLELVQNSPGVTASRLADKLGVSERAVRRYVGILREAEVPIESTSGPYGGYRVGRGLRVPPLMFTTTEALGLVMAVLDGHHDAADTSDPVGSAIGKIIRVLPEPVASPVEAVRTLSTRLPDRSAASPTPEITAELARACGAHHRIRLTYRLSPDTEREMEVDPWAVVVRHSKWYLLCWSHTKNARRVLRVDRVAAIHELDATFTPPVDLNPGETLEAHLAEGWEHKIEVVVDAPVDQVARWIPRSMGRTEPIDAGTTLLIATTDEPHWYAAQLLALKAPFHIRKPPEVQAAARQLADRLSHASIGVRETGARETAGAEEEGR